MPQCDVCDPVIRESLNFTLDTLELQLSCPTASGPRRGRGGSAACDLRRSRARGVPSPSSPFNVKGPALQPPRRCNRLVDVRLMPASSSTASARAPSPDAVEPRRRRAPTPSGN